MAGREPFTGILFAHRPPFTSEDHLCLYPEDDLRPPARETLSVSPEEGEDLIPEVGRNPSPCVSPLRRGEQEGSFPPSESTRGVLRRRDAAIPPSVARSSL